MKGAKWASGKWANAICDVCGIRCKYVDLRAVFVRGMKTGLLACDVCWDPDHPQNFLDRYVTTDPQALRNARPDTGLQASRVLYPPGNWINGQPPTLKQKAEMEAAKEEIVGR